MEKKKIYTLHTIVETRLYIPSGSMLYSAEWELNKVSMASFKAILQFPSTILIRERIPLWRNVRSVIHVSIIIR